MDKYRFRVGRSFILEVNAKSIPAAWFRVAQKYNDLIADYGYIEYIGVKHTYG